VGKATSSTTPAATTEAAASTAKSAARDAAAAALSSREIERDRGKPLSKYERNVMIFDWLHTLDETAPVDLN
jgi:hypothetical protein